MVTTAASLSLVAACDPLVHRLSQQQTPHRMRVLTTVLPIRTYRRPCYFSSTRNPCHTGQRILHRLHSHYYVQTSLLSPLARRPIDLRMNLLGHGAEPILPWTRSTAAPSLARVMLEPISSFDWNECKHVNSNLCVGGTPILSLVGLVKGLFEHFSMQFLARNLRWYSL